jgi:hypothetical protein
MKKILSIFAFLAFSLGAVAQEEVEIFAAGGGTLLRKSNDNMVANFEPALSTNPLKQWDACFDRRRGNIYIWNGISWASINSGLDDGQQADVPYTLTNPAGNIASGWNPDTHNKMRINYSTPGVDTFYIDTIAFGGTLVPGEKFTIVFSTQSRTADADTVRIHFNKIWKDYYGQYIGEWICPPRGTMTMNFQVDVSVEGATLREIDDILGSYGHGGGGGGGGFARPAQEVVYGTGTGASSEPKFKYDSLQNRLNVDTLRAVKVAGAVYDKGGAVYHVAEFGIYPNGTDQTAAINRMDSILFAQGVRGYTRQWGEGTYLINGVIKYPTNYNGANIPQIATIVEQGVGGYQSGNGQIPLGGTILDCRYTADTLGTFQLRGSGKVEFDRLIFKRGVNSSVKTAFIHTTLATIHVHDCAFLGFSTSARNHAITLGGNLGFLVAPDTSQNMAFQGYGTSIHDNYFDRIETCVNWKTYANSVFVHHNNVWNGCGGYAAFRVEPTGDNGVGNVIADNLIEMNSYKYGIVLGTMTSSTILRDNEFFDQLPGVLANIWHRGTSTNTVYAGNKGGTIRNLKTDNTGYNFFATESGDTTHQAVNWKIRNGNWFGTQSLSTRTYAADGTNSWLDMSFDNSATRAFSIRHNMLGVAKTFFVFRDYNPTKELDFQTTASEFVNVTPGAGNIRFQFNTGKECWVGTNHLFISGTMFGGVGGNATPFKLGQGQRIYWADTASPTAGSTIGFTSPAIGRLQVVNAAGSLAGAFEVAASPYGVGWNGSVAVPTRDDVYDKIETLDPSITNEGSLTVAAGGSNDAQIVSNTSGATPVTIAGGNRIKVAEAGSIISIYAEDTVYIKLTPLAFSDSLKTVSELEKDYFNIPSELNGYKIAKVEYATRAAGSGTGSVVVGLRAYSSTRTITYSNGNAVSFTAGDVIKTSTGTTTVTTGQLLVAQITTDTLVTHHRGLSVMLMLTK